MRNAERSRQWYEDVLGLHTYHYRPGRAAFMSADKEKSHEVALMQVGDDAPLQQKGQVGLNHLACMMDSLDDLKDAYYRLKEKGVKFDHISDHGLSLGIYFRDPDGNGLEVSYELPREKWPRQDSVFAPDVVGLGSSPGRGTRRSRSRRHASRRRQAERSRLSRDTGPGGVKCPAYANDSAVHGLRRARQASDTLRCRSPAFAAYELVVVPVHDQPRRRHLGQPIDRGEAMAMAGRRFVRHQHVEAMLCQPGEILREDQIAVPQRQPAAPVLARREARQEFVPRGEARRFDPAAALRARIPDARLEHPAQAGDAQPADLDHLAADVALGKIGRQIIEHGIGLGVLVAEDPVHAQPSANSGPAYGAAARAARSRRAGSACRGSSAPHARRIGGKLPCGSPAMTIGVVTRGTSIIRRGRSPADARRGRSSSPG